MSWWPFSQSPAETLVESVKKNDFTRVARQAGLKTCQEKVGGATALHYAAKGGNLKMVQLLIQRNSDINAIAETEAADFDVFELGPKLLGMTPIRIAQAKGHRHIVKFLERVKAKERGIDNTINLEEDQFNVVGKSNKKGSAEHIDLDERKTASNDEAPRDAVIGITAPDIPKTDEKTADGDNNELPDTRGHAISIEEIKELQNIKRMYEKIQLEQQLRLANFYPLCKSPGRALVIGNGTCGRVKRVCNADAEAMANTLGLLGFDVSLGLNLTKSEILMKVVQLSVESYKNHGMFLMFYSGHGSNGTIWGHQERRRRSSEDEDEDDADEYQVQLNYLFETFQAPNAHKTLQGKPKVFLWDCCRGSNWDKGTKGHDTTDDSYTPPKHTDFLYSYATAQDFVAHVGDHKISDGLSLWTYCLQKRFLENQEKYHLEELLTLIQKDVSELVKKTPKKKQAANHNSFLRKFVKM